MTETYEEHDYELYDGFSGPWSWETTSLQEMGFPPTPELEPKNNANNNKKNKRKKNLTVTGDEEINDLRTYETLEELKARLKANYIEAKEQREKYLNLKREQSNEEKRAKSVRGDRDKIKQHNLKKNKNTPNKSNVELPKNILGSFRAKRDQSHPYMVKSSSANNQISAQDSFHSELSNAVLKSASNSKLEVPASSNPGVNIMNNRISPQLNHKNSPSKSLTIETGSSGSHITGTTQTANKNGSFELFVTATEPIEHPIENNKINILKSNSIHSNINITISSEDSPPPELTRKTSKRRSAKRGDSRDTSVKSRGSSNSREGSLKRKDGEKKEAIDSTDGITYLPLTDSNTAEENANESVIQNDNTDIEVSTGLGNVMDMLSNW